MSKSLLLLAVVWFLSFAIASASVKLPFLLSDHMVLLKSAKTPLWGTADPGEQVTVTLGAQTASAVAGPDGAWKTQLDLHDSPPGPFDVTIQGKNKIVITDVVVGEVWVASGQSNMYFQLKSTQNGAAEVAASANPQLREFQVGEYSSPPGPPIDNCKGSWSVADPKTSGLFSGVAYYFGKKLQNTLQVPVGIIHGSIGATQIEVWMPPEAFNGLPDIEDIAKKRIASYQQFRDQIEGYPALLTAWMKQASREDVPADPAPFAGEQVPAEGWTTVKLPGEIAGDNLPANGGVVWIRKEIDLPADMSPPQLQETRLILLFSASFGTYDTVYWNGQKAVDTPFDRPPSNGRNYSIMAKYLKPGRNVLAIRLYNPAKPPVILAEKTPFDLFSTTHHLPMPGDWQVKAEKALPPLDAAATQSMPPLPSRTIEEQRQVIPCTYFNGMIRPLIPYAIRGFIWYQGEWNTGQAYQYRELFPRLIESWRARWNLGDIPFFWCQLPYNGGMKKEALGNDTWPELREAQSMALKLPHTGQAVLVDLRESILHPLDKKDPGERLALIALAQTYGKAMPYSGPVYRAIKIEGNKIRISFDHTDGGLAAAALPETSQPDMGHPENTRPIPRNSPNSALQGFILCGDDKNWVWADAAIEGNEVVVSSPQVTAPVAVRYAWADAPVCNLTNGSGLPAAPFRTDDYPLLTLDNLFGKKP